MFFIKIQEMYHPLASTTSPDPQNKKNCVKIVFCKNLTNVFQLFITFYNAFFLKCLCSVQKEFR